MFSTLDEPKLAGGKGEKKRARWPKVNSGDKKMPLFLLEGHNGVYKCVY
jgi:hypothetical protein